MEAEVMDREVMDGEEPSKPLDLLCMKEREADGTRNF
jgi:hypothetical protein